MEGNGILWPEIDQEGNNKLEKLVSKPVYSLAQPARPASPPFETAAPSGGGASCCIVSLHGLGDMWPRIRIMRWSTGGSPSASQLPRYGGHERETASEARVSGKSPRSSTSRGLGCRRGRRVGTQQRRPRTPTRLGSPEKNFWNKRLEG